jgi:RNA 2',3'-cyclic 3'-phosphodiesterase
MSGPDSIRAFVAVPVPEAVLHAIRRAQQEFAQRLRVPEVRWLQPEQIHLTLAFLGRVAVARLEELKAVLAQACRSVGPFSLQAEGCGCFPDPQRPRVIWVGLAGDREILCHLREAVAAATAPFAEHVETRSFQPHLTIARLKPAAPATLRSIGRIIQDAPATVLGEWHVRAVDLMQSELTPGGAVYRRLLSAPLAGPDGAW